MYLNPPEASKIPAMQHSFHLVGIVGLSVERPCRRLFVLTQSSSCLATQDSKLHHKAELRHVFTALWHAGLSLNWRRVIWNKINLGQESSIPAWGPINNDPDRDCLWIWAAKCALTFPLCIRLIAQCDSSQLYAWGVIQEWGLPKRAKCMWVRHQDPPPAWWSPHSPCMECKYTMAGAFKQEAAGLLVKIWQLTEAVLIWLKSLYCWSATASAWLFRLQVT